MTTIPETPVPGLFAVSDPGLRPDDAERMMRRVVGTPFELVPPPGPDGVWVAVWGDGPHALVHRGWALLASGAREGDRDVSRSDDVAAMLHAGDSGGFRRLLPPVAAALLEAGGSLVAATDHVGLRQLFHASTPGRAAVSTSSSALARWSGAALDHEALAVQSLLGWQIGERTIFDGVARLPAGSLTRLGGGRVELTRREASATRAPGPSLAGAVHEAAQLLSTYLTRCLEDHPDIVLQLSGGLDTRVLLAAIPRELRRGLRAMTLGDGDSTDVAIARGLADGCGMDHVVLPLGGLESLSPGDAFGSCVDASRRLDHVADPLSLAAIRHAEGTLATETRLGGVGGETARGFYYAGPALPIPTGRLVSLLVARYRMFTNEAVSGRALEPDFAAWARRFTENEITGVLGALDYDFYRALDEFYLRERVQRWAGATATAVVFDRIDIHPLMDHRFVELVRSVPPRHKAGNLFVAQLLMTMDADLGRIELDGRPAPAFFASRRPTDQGRKYRLAGGKLVRKVRQKYSDTRRAPAGGSVLAESLAEYWRSSPGTLDGLDTHTAGVFRHQWLDEVREGLVKPDPSEAAFLTNVLAAGMDRRAPAGAARPT